jgi:hypothetical protein
MHLIYAVLAIMLVGLFSMNMHRSMHQSQNKMVVNEVVTELTGAAYDVLELIGRLPFDENTDESKKDPLEYPVINGTGQLSSSAQFGGCEALEFIPTDCDDIDDFHAIPSVTVDVDGLEYEMDVAVQYVDPSNPDTPSGGNSFAKEVAITITNPYFRVGGEPLQVTIKRIFTYNRHTTAP